jgi:hypothetical protein
MVLIVDTAKEDDVESIVKLVDNWLGEIKWSWQADRSFTIRNILGPVLIHFLVDSIPIILSVA